MDVSFLGFAFFLVSLADLDRFPDHEAAIAWADRHIEWIEAQQQLDRVYAAFWNEWRMDAVAARQPWRELMLARCQGNSDEWRLRRLNDLRCLIGAERYQRGEMPTFYPPLWRFTER